MGVYGAWSEKNRAGIPDQMPMRYKWHSVKDKITEDEFFELNALVDNSMNWKGEDDPDYLRWKELDKKACPF